MKRKKDIYELIQSLNKTEKRYFKLNSNRYDKNRENNYIQVFDFINKKGINSDSELLKHFKNKITPNQLAVTKNYLYKMLLKSMGDYYKTQNDTLGDMLIHINFLIHKGLIDQAREIIQTAKKEVYSSGQLMYEMELLELELKITDYTPEKHSMEVLEHTHDRQNEILEQQKLVIYYKHLFYKKGLLQQKGSLNGFGHYNQGFERIYKESLSHSNSEYHTFESLHYMHVIHKHCSLALKNYADFHRHGKALILHLRNNPDQVNHDPEKLVWGYYSYIYSYILLKKETAKIDAIFKEFDEVIETKLSRKKTAYVLGKMIYYTFYLKRNVSLNDNRVDPEFICTIQHFVQENNRLIPERYKMLFEYYFAYHYFNAGEFKKCLSHLQNTFSLYNQRSGIGKDIFIISKLLQAFCYRSLNEVDQLEYALMSVYRYLYLDSTKKIFEKKVLLLIKNLIKTNPDYQQLEVYVDELNTNRELKLMFDLFDFQRFIENEINKESQVV